jgi:hypothetical protein
MRYRHRDDNGDLLVHFRDITNKRRTYFFQLFTVHSASDVRPIEAYTMQPLVPTPSPSGLKLLLQTPWPLARKRTVPTERPPLVGEI